MTDEQVMLAALTEARQAESAGEVPVGAAIFREGALIAAGHNQREALQDPTAHAEMIALRAAARKLGSWRLDGCVMAVTLEPCPMCAGALVNARLPRLVYGAADPKMGCVHTLHQLCTDERFNHRIDVTAGVLADQCGRLLSSFFQRRRCPDRPPKPQARG